MSPLSRVLVIDAPGEGATVVPVTFREHLELWGENVRRGMCRGNGLAGARGPAVAQNDFVIPVRMITPRDSTLGWFQQLANTIADCGRDNGAWRVLEEPLVAFYTEKDAGTKRVFVLLKAAEDGRTLESVGRDRTSSHAT